MRWHHSVTKQILCRGPFQFQSAFHRLTMGKHTDPAPPEGIEAGKKAAAVRAVNELIKVPQICVITFMCVFISLSNF